MWAFLFFALGVHTVLSSPPHPVNVTFTSVNLRNILRWSPGSNTPADTKYRVQYAIYGDRKENRANWRPVLHCTEITRTWCDLSVETSDLEHGYYAKVRATRRKASSEWELTPERFDPKIVTEFGPPYVSVKVDGNFVIVTLEGPMKYDPNNSLAPQVSMATVYPHMTYKLSINNTHRGHSSHVTLKSNQYKYRTVDPGTKMCFSAKTELNYLTVKHHPSDWHCVLVPRAPLIDRLERIVIISTAVPAVLLCLLAAGSYVLYKYLLGTDQKSPGNLVMSKSLPPLLPTPSESVNIIVIPVVIDDAPCNKIYSKLQNPTDAFCNENKDGEERDVKIQSYRQKEFEVTAEPSGSSSASRNSSPQSSVSSMNPVPLSSSQNEGEPAGSLGYASQSVQPVQAPDPLHDLPDDYGFVGPSAYASQSAPSVQQMERADSLPDNYGLVGPAAAEVEDSDCLRIDWSPSTKRLIIPGLVMQTVHEGLGSPLRNRVDLDTVFVRQPSEEEALLGAEGGGWDPEEFMAKYDLVLSDD